MNHIYPWQDEHFQRLVQLHKQGRLPHALLLNGVSGIGKHNLAENLAQSLVCESPDEAGHACNQCHTCALFKADTHPDVLRISPEEKSKVIRIDQVRQLIGKLGLHSHYGRFKVAIIEPAGAMNTAAANSLLKTLEEPSDNTLLILVTDRLAKLPATIRSRCQVIKIKSPDRNHALKWLEDNMPSDHAPAMDAGVLLSLAHNRPLAALELLEDERLSERNNMLKSWQELAMGREDPVKIAALWSKSDINIPLSWLYGWLCDMIRLKTTSTSQLENPDQKATLHNLAERLDLGKIFDLLARVEEGIKLQDSQVNSQSILEGILLHWSNLPRRNQ